MNTIAGILIAALSADITTQSVAYRDGDVELQGYLARPAERASESTPGVIVVHEWWGLNEFAKQKARELAQMGYVAFAVDMYGGGRTTESPEQAGEWARGIAGDTDRLVKRAAAGLRVLRAQPGVQQDRIGAIGFCFGGTTVLRMAAGGLDVRGVVSFHGSLPVFEQADLERTRAQLLVLHGAADTLVPDRDLTRFMDSLRGSNIDWRVVVYGNAKHSFTNPKADGLGMEGVGYDARTAERAWSEMRRFFESVLNG